MSRILMRFFPVICLSMLVACASSGPRGSARDFALRRGSALEFALTQVDRDGRQLIIAADGSVDEVRGLLPHRRVMTAATPDDTEFAKTYSSIGFWRVHEGMTPEQVKRLVGPPLETYPLPGGFGWRWSRSPHDSNYRIRIVTFVAGRAVAKFSEYYVD